MNCKYCSWAAKLSCAVGTTFPGQWVHWKPPHTTSNFRNVDQICERHKNSILEHHFLKQCGPGRYRVGGGAFAQCLRLPYELLELGRGPRRVLQDVFEASVYILVRELVEVVNLGGRLDVWR